ncbi:MAG: recombination protein RecR, partial [Deltaproteobacteria bacterium CG07_land_8_20_14_0_80_38_7]
MPRFPLVIQNLTDSFSRLPGVGPKTALRFVFYLLRQKQEDNIKFAKAIEMLVNSIATCQICQNFSEKNPCAICSDRNRDQSVICVVAEHQDLPVIENTGEYRGAYHILGGVLDPLHGITPDQLKIKELIYRVQNNNIKEIVLALNPDLEGETTILYLTKLIK